MAEKERNEQDRILGRNIRALRLSAGLTQRDVADLFGLTYQQIQKYEKGTSRLPARMLTTLKSLYNVPYETFFTGTSEKTCPARPGSFHHFDTLTLKISHKIAAITDRRLKQKIGKIVDIVAD